MIAVMDHPDGTRTCTACGDRKPLEEYDKDKTATLGRRSHCKPCRSQKMKDWYAANRERQAQRQRDRFLSNNAAIRVQDMQRYERHKDKRIALATDGVHRRRALMTGAGSDEGITVAALRKIHGDRCAYCAREMSFVRAVGRKKLPDKATIEHLMPLSRGGSHTWDNVVLACWQCNLDKNAMTPVQWEARLASR